MAMAVDIVDDDFFIDPDTVKVAEGPAHRRATDLVATLAQHLLGSGSVVYRDMNWYPTDGGNAVAPDAMVLPAGTLPDGAKSHKQASRGGPAPSVVVEVPSDTDSYASFRAKLRRYQRLGVPCYVVDIEGPECSISRLGPNDREPQPWDGEPMAELGGLVLVSTGASVLARLDDGTLIASHEELLGQLTARIAELEAQLRGGATPAGA